MQMLLWHQRSKFVVICRVQCSSTQNNSACLATWMTGLEFSETSGGRTISLQSSYWPSRRDRCEELPRHSEIVKYSLNTISFQQRVLLSRSKCLTFTLSTSFVFTFGPSGVVEILLWGALVEVRDFTQKKIENLNACTWVLLHSGKVKQH